MIEHGQCSQTPKCFGSRSIKFPLYMHSSPTPLVLFLDFVVCPFELWAVHMPLWFTAFKTHNVDVMPLVDSYKQPDHTLQFDYTMTVLLAFLPLCNWAHLVWQRCSCPVQKAPMFILTILPVPIQLRLADERVRDRL